MAKYYELVDGMGNVKRYFFIAGGSIALGIGLIGLILPVLPTTPFLLLAALCYMRGSSRLYNALLNNRFVGKYIHNYLYGKGMTIRTKIWTLIFLWATLAVTAFLTTDKTILRILLAAVLGGVTAHILLLKTSRDRENTPA